MPLSFFFLPFQTLGVGVVGVLCTPGVYTYTPHLSFLFIFLSSQDGGYWWFIGGLFVVYWWFTPVVVYSWFGPHRVRYGPGVLRPSLGPQGRVRCPGLKLVLQSCELKLLTRDNYSWVLQLSKSRTSEVISSRMSFFMLISFIFVVVASFSFILLIFLTS